MVCCVDGGTAWEEGVGLGGTAVVAQGCQHGVPAGCLGGATTGAVAGQAVGAGGDCAATGGEGGLTGDDCVNQRHRATVVVDAGDGARIVTERAVCQCDRATTIGDSTSSPGKGFIATQRAVRDRCYAGPNRDAA